MGALVEVQDQLVPDLEEAQDHPARALVEVQDQLVQDLEETQDHPARALTEVQDLLAQVPVEPLEEVQGRQVPVEHQGQLVLDHQTPAQTLKTQEGDQGE